jgi:hypothetical protein
MRRRRPQAATLRLRRKLLLSERSADETVGNMFEGGEVGRCVIFADARFLVAEHQVQPFFDGQAWMNMRPVLETVNLKANHVYMEDLTGWP